MVMKSSIFWDITLCSPCKLNRRFGGTCRLPATWFALVSCLSYSSVLNREATCSSGASVDFQWTTRRYTSKDRNLQNGMCFLCPTCSVRLIHVHLISLTMLVKNYRLWSSRLCIFAISFRSCPNTTLCVLVWTTVSLSDVLPWQWQTKSPIWTKSWNTVLYIIIFMF
jgi:hypothetical protein